jgi:membrane glycosyltransferase
MSENEDFDAAHAPAARRRRLVLPLLVLAPAALATRLMADVLDGGGLAPLEIALVALFAVLFAGVSFGFWTVLAGSASSCAAAIPLTSAARGFRFPTRCLRPRS